MLLKELYDFIIRTQAEIGNGAEIRLYAVNNALEIRVDWWDEDYHARQQFTEQQLTQEGEQAVARFIAWCRHDYTRYIEVLRG